MTSKFLENVLWMNNFGLYSFYERSIANQLFDGYGNDYMVPQNDTMTGQCQNYPIDKRKKVAQNTTQIYMTETISQTLKLKHLEKVLILLAIGLGIAILCFLLELIIGRK